MTSIKTNAIVLSSVKYGEADLIVTCFTKEVGLVSFFMRGIRKSKRGKFKSSFFQSLSCLDLDFMHRDQKNLQFLKDAKVAIPYKSLHQNIYKSCIAMFLAEVLKACIREEERNLELYLFIENALIALDEAEKFSNFHLLFLVELTRFLGFYPEMNHQNLAYFNMIEGRFEAEDSSIYTVQNSNVDILERILNQQKTDLFQNLGLNQKKRQDFLDFIIYYYELHLQSFYKPKSKEILEQLF
ncbi:DNA repair protein RecO [Psychroflexus halocasei]|uniref:DNA repair protein RecO n=1 Tax=Psychroflexus halocasei TaxID=908615 RepID=A0A1H4BQK5_9FLAO|nr:DNA repair protein RecO [Psychroflexus halocasei]SEA50368.1 DNA replication and repair protein RecO [Psychroflexus halocasei]